MSLNNADAVAAMLARARSRGVTPQALRGYVQATVTRGVHDQSWHYPYLVEQADSINKAGLRSQISYLVEALGSGATKVLIDSVNVLDTFTKAATSAEDPTDFDDESVDEDGDPWE